MSEWKNVHKAYIGILQVIFLNKDYICWPGSHMFVQQAQTVVEPFSQAADTGLC